MLNTLQGALDPESLTWSFSGQTYQCFHAADSSITILRPLYALAFTYLPRSNSNHSSQRLEGELKRSIWKLLHIMCYNSASQTLWSLYPFTPWQILQNPKERLIWVMSTYIYRIRNRQWETPKTQERTAHVPSAVTAMTTSRNLQPLGHRTAHLYGVRAEGQITSARYLEDSFDPVEPLKGIQRPVSSSWITSGEPLRYSVTRMAVPVISLEMQGLSKGESLRTQICGWEQRTATTTKNDSWSQELGRWGRW